RHHGRLGQPVVIAGHHVAVRTGSGHREQVARCDVRRLPAVSHHDVTRLAVLSHDAGQHGSGLRTTGNDPAVVGRVVQRGADIVAHPAVDADVAPVRTTIEVHVLDGADLVHSDHAWTDDRTSGFHLDARRGQA